MNKKAEEGIFEVSVKIILWIIFIGFCLLAIGYLVYNKLGF